MEKNITDEEIDRIRNYVDRYSYSDLTRWFDDMTSKENTDNRLFDIISFELIKRLSRREVTDLEYNRIKSNISKYSYLSLFRTLSDMITINNTKDRLFKLIDGELSRRMKENELSIEDNEEIEKYFSRHSYLDLVMWRNDLLNNGKINNQLYVLIEHEINRRNSISIKEERRK